LSLTVAFTLFDVLLTEELDLRLPVVGQMIRIVPPARILTKDCSIVQFLLTSNETAMLTGFFP
jgi:hypothetical protein